MGWFEEQMKERKKLDEKKFNDSFLALAGMKPDNPDDHDEIARRENFAISQIISHFHRPMVDIPSKIDKFSDKLNYALGQAKIEYHKIELTEDYSSDNNEPILIFTITDNLPVVLFPSGKNSYYYINFKTRKRVKISASIVNGLEMEAYSFYIPLPGKTMSIKDFVEYVRKSVRPIDIVMVLLFTLLASGIGLLVPLFTKQLTGDVINSKDINQFVVVSLYVVGAATGLLIAESIKGYVNSRISLKIEKGVQQATMMRLLYLPVSFFKKYNTGEITSRVNSVISLTNLIVTSLFTTLVSVIMSIAYLSQLVGIVPSLVIPVIFILLISSGFTVLVSLLQKANKRKELQLSSKEAGVTYEMINGIQKIRLSGSEKRVFAKWARAYSKTARVRYRPPLIIRLAPAISLLINLIGNSLIFFIASKNNVEVSSYMAFVASYGVLSSAFVSLTGVVGTVMTIQPVFEMARPILESEPEIDQGKIKIERVSGNIKLENVSFRYSENSPLVVDDLSLNIKEGEYLAIVGKTGCGKSTLVRLLLGFEKPINGKIYYDDLDIDEMDLTTLRRNIGTVMQNGTLFHADIFSNIIISAPNLTEEDAWNAAQIADIADDIKQMPMRMKTVISEGQGGISGGQKQRIMIARAIVHKPKILIFDEATSALDNKTQKSISESISKLNCTRIVIAHRLSTIQNADRIIMLENGHIIEEGDYDTLMKNKGKFAELVDRQRLDK